MNNDLISRKYMKVAIEQFFVREKYYHPYSKGRKTIPTEEVLDIIDNAPTVEAYTLLQVKDLVELNQKLIDELEERPQGKWKPFNAYYRKCDKCERMVGFDYADPEHGNWFNYCPNCGADMREGDTE